MAAIEYYEHYFAQPDSRRWAAEMEYVLFCDLLVILTVIVGEIMSADRNDTTNTTEEPDARSTPWTE